MNSIAAKLDEYGTLAWVTLMVVSFIVFWPLGLLVLFYMAWSGRMKCWSSRGEGRWSDKVEQLQQKASSWCGGQRRQTQTSGNSAFDEYREETLRRLEEEQREFRSFLEQLRHAKDKAEFDQFMADRGRRSSSSPQPGA